MINIQSKSAFNKKTFSVPLILFEKLFSVPLILFEKLEMKSRKGGGRKSAQSGGGVLGNMEIFFMHGSKTVFFSKISKKWPKNSPKRVENQEITTFEQKIYIQSIPGPKN